MKVYEMYYFKLKLWKDDSMNKLTKDSEKHGIKRQFVRGLCKSCTGEVSQCVCVCQHTYTTKKYILKQNK